MSRRVVRATGVLRNPGYAPSLRRMFKKLASHFQGLGLRLLSISDTPRALAGGVAIGIFMGFTPLFGLKTLLCLGAAALLRCNPLAAVIAVSLHDVVAPLWPVLLHWEYEWGRAVLLLLPGVQVPVLPQDFHIHDVMKWTTFLGIGLPMLAGSVFLSVPFSVLTYLLLYPVFERRQKRRRATSEIIS